ncbi:MAG: hypothetical protein DMG39_08605 [Acidobacteria bacterium]|nr:MAG: hypothetical protein DMG39_08605 [Acidobacteriota bacterium]
MSSPFTVSFDSEFQYRSVPGLDPSVLFPALPVGVIGPQGAEDLLAIVDTGATYLLFNGNRAKSIGLDLMRGRLITLTGLSGSMPARIHRVTLEILGSTIDCSAFLRIPIRWLCLVDCRWASVFFNGMECRGRDGGPCCP